MFKAVGSILGRTVAHKAQDKLQAPLWFPVPSALPPQQFHNQQELQALFDIKMAIILPTGQWYAPSAVINDAWYCMV